MLGKRKNELGGSEYYRLKGELGANVPKPDLKEAKAQIYAVTDAISEGLIESAHDISDGGIAVTIAEMALGGQAEGKIGAEVDVSHIAESDVKTHQKLFSETGGFVVEVTPENKDKFMEICHKNGVEEPIEMGKTNASAQISILDNQKQIVNISLQQAAEKWLNGLRSKI